MNKKYKLGLYEKALPSELNWNEKLRTAKQAGFDYIEISIDESDEKLERLNWSSPKIRQLSATAHDEDMQIGSICLSAHRKYPLGGTNTKRSLEIMEKAVRFAAEAGIRIIQLAGYDSYYQQSTAETRQRFLCNLQISVEMAEKEGVLMGFETMETPFMDTVGKAMTYISKIDSPYLGIYPDIGNLNNAALLYNTDVCEDLEKGKGHLIEIHIKETVPGKYREVPFETGFVDFKKILRKSWELGIRRYVTELWYTRNNDWKDKITEAADMASGILDAFA
jgi:predicted hexulose-6-phosphate isomerase